LRAPLTNLFKFRLGHPEALALNLHGAKHRFRVAALLSCAIFRELEEVELHVSSGDCLVARVDQTDAEAVAPHRKLGASQDRRHVCAFGRLSFEERRRRCWRRRR